MELKERALIMANARRLIKAHKATSNARLYAELFGAGNGTARCFCRDVGINPDGNETSFNGMMKRIDDRVSSIAQ